MMRYGVSFALSEIFFTHFHADHFLGVIGLIRTLGLQGRPEPLFLYGPRGAKKILTTAMQLGVDRLPFPIEITEVKEGDVVGGGDGGRGKRDGYEIVTFATEHGGGPSLGYALKEQERRGRFDVEKAKAAGIPEGPLWGKLSKGEAIEVDGRHLSADAFVGPKRPGRMVVFTGDTRPCASVVDAAQGADLLIHEATFGDEEKDRAKDTGHSTAKEAAQVALAAKAKRLVLCHVSARYSISADELVKEAKEVFPNVGVAKDGMEIDVPFSE
jgi:ribonuclease Z